ncbi:hypothetical protein ACWIUH_11660 [Ursidibacter arcticus]
MVDIIDKLKPIFAKLQQCKNDDQALAVLQKYVEKSELNKNECFALGILYIEEERRKQAKLQHTKRTNQKGFVMNY